uniref:Uncharacterized protein n=1 Tax=Bacteriophage sp. TaxID=38018 RepID=A0A8D9UHM5_9VIRU|nr:MAG TPA: hypothetical protein [Bacteriophage sp.]
MKLTTHLLLIHTKQNENTKIVLTETVVKMFL